MSLPVQYAGIPLNFHSAELQEWAASNIPYSWLAEFSERGWPGYGLRQRPWPGIKLPRGPVQLGVLRWPAGAANFATAHFAVSDERMTAIRAIAQGSTHLAPATLQMGDGVQTSMYMLPARPLSYAPDGNPLWLLTLVDERYFWWFRAANIVVLEEITTWDSVYQQLSAGINPVGSFTWDTVSDYYTQPPYELNGSYEPLPIQLDAVALSVGQRIVRNFDGTVRAMNANSSQAIFDANLALYSPSAGIYYHVEGGGELKFDPTVVNDLGCVLPESVTVAYRKTIDGMLSDKRFALSINFTDLSFGTGLSGANVKTFSGTRLLRDVAKATCFGANPFPTNLDNLTTLARQIATDYYLHAAGPKLAINFTDFRIWTPEGFTEEILYQWGGSTRLEPGTWMDHADELFHLTPTATTSTSGSSSSSSSSGSQSGSGSGSAGSSAGSSAASQASSAGSSSAASSAASSASQSASASSQAAICAEGNACCCALPVNTLLSGVNISCFPGSSFTGSTSQQYTPTPGYGQGPGYVGSYPVLCEGGTSNAFYIYCESGVWFFRAEDGVTIGTANSCSPLSISFPGAKLNGGGTADMEFYATYPCECPSGSSHSHSSTSINCPVVDQFFSLVTTPIYFHVPDRYPSTLWANFSGLWSVADLYSGYAYVSTLAFASWADRVGGAVIESTLSDAVITAKLLASGLVELDTHDLGVVFRYTDPNNMWLARISYDNQTLDIVEINGAVATVRATVPGVFATGTTYDMIVTLNGAMIEVDVYELLGFVTSAGYSSSFNQLATQHGILSGFYSTSGVVAFFDVCPPVALSSSSSSSSASSSSAAGPVTTTCCPSNPLPSVLTATITMNVGTCACATFPLVVTLTYNPGTAKWEGSATFCDTTIILSFYCEPGGTTPANFSLTTSFANACSATLTTGGSGACSPLSLSFGYAMMPPGCGDCTPAAGFIITVTP